jgi:hypothetical protein
MGLIEMPNSGWRETQKRIFIGNTEKPGAVKKAILRRPESSPPHG